MGDPETLVQKVDLRALRAGHEGIVPRRGHMLDHCEMTDLPVDQEILS